MKATPNMLTWALRYAGLGWSVLPVAPGDKVPAVRGGRGVYDATRNPAQVRHLWTRWPRNNIGIAGGLPSGLLVLDVDPRNGGDETLGALERRFGRLPLSPRVLTPGGGQHLYFRHPDEFLRTRATLGDGLDVKGNGGFVVAPPSIHPNGARYVWDVGALPSETPVSDPPGWLLELLTKGKAAPPRALAPEGSARETFLGAAFASLGWLGQDLDGGKVAARCPWAELHSDGRGAGDDSSTVLFPGSALSKLGAFKCSHAHCANRCVDDVLGVLPPAAMEAAARAAPQAFATAVRRLARAAVRRAAP